MIKVKLEVTNDDIDQGIAESPCECPIALALKRVLGIPTINVQGAGGIDFFMVGFTWFHKYQHEFERNLIDGFIEDFDNNRKVYPFTMELEFEAADRDEE